MYTFSNESGKKRSDIKLWEQEEKHVDAKRISNCPTAISISDLILSEDVFDNKMRQSTEL